MSAEQGLALFEIPKMMELDKEAISFIALAFGGRLFSWFGCHVGGGKNRRAARVGRRGGGLNNWEEHKQDEWS